MSGLRLRTGLSAALALLWGGCYWQVEADEDGDGVVVSEDCDDQDPAVGRRSGGCDSRPWSPDVSGDTGDCEPRRWYVDYDQDGWGSPVGLEHWACEQPVNLVDNSQDCNDQAPDIHPGAQERCDGVDEDCDDRTDEESVDALVWYLDEDHDAYGSADEQEVACGPPDGFVDNVEDCDDSNPRINPGEDEVCDGVDNDCDGTIDGADAVDAWSWYVDVDDDGYGGIESRVVSCHAPEGEWTLVGGDCADRDRYTNPGQAQFFHYSNIQGSFDYNCDGTDEPEYPSVGSCTDSGSSCVYAEGYEQAVPACGDYGRRVLLCDALCQPGLSSEVVMRCR